MERMVGHEPADPGSNPGENKALAGIVAPGEASNCSPYLVGGGQKCEPESRFGRHPEGLNCHSDFWVHTKDLPNS